MSHLLKQKSKIGVKQKERVQYETFDFVKKSKDNEGNAVTHAQGNQKQQASSTGAHAKNTIKAKVLEKYDDPMTNK